ncbi:hypothetical protein DFH28DRAFT_1126459 [Melampsora americana]|nr:hypothetical protein DFH28DRAFT_1126459 [Melampsora americana]
MRSELFPSIGKTKVQYSNGTVHHIHTCGNSAYWVVDAHTESAHCVYIDYSFTTQGTSHPEIATLYLPQLTLNGTYVDQAFKIIIRNETVGPEVPGMYGLRNLHTTIVTRNEAGKSVEWVIKCVAYGGTNIILDVDGVYYLKGRLLALNTKDIQKFYYKPDYQLLANTSENLVCNLANAVSVTRLGIIATRTSEVLEPGKENIHLIVKHSDYNPDTQLQHSFDVEYRALWSKLMEKLQPLMTVGREVMLTGHIVGRNEAQHMWIVQVTGVSVTSGHEANPPTTPVMGQLRELPHEGVTAARC